MLAVTMHWRQNHLVLMRSINERSLLTFGQPATDLVAIAITKSIAVSSSTYLLTGSAKESLSASSNEMSLAKCH